MSTGDRCLCSMLFLLCVNQGLKEQTQPLKKLSGFCTHQDYQSDTHSGTAEDKGSTLLCLSMMTCLIFENVL